MSGESQFVEGEGLLAVWAGAAGADPGAEHVIVGAALLPGVSGVVVWALIDVAAPAASGRCRDDVGGMALTIPAGLLDAGWVAVALASAGRRQRAAATRASGLGRQAVDTQRKASPNTVQLR